MLKLPIAVITWVVNGVTLTLIYLFFPTRLTLNLAPQFPEVTELAMVKSVSPTAPLISAKVEAFVLSLCESFNTDGLLDTASEVDVITSMLK